MHKLLRTTNLQLGHDSSAYLYLSWSAVVVICVNSFKLGFRRWYGADGWVREKLI